MSAFLQSGRFHPGETPIFRFRFRPEALGRQTVITEVVDPLDPLVNVVPRQRQGAGT